MGYFIGRTIIYGTIFFLCVVGYWIYAILFADPRVNYFSMGNINLNFGFSLLAGIALSLFDPFGIKKAQESPPPQADESSDANIQKKASKTAKAGVILGAAALAKATQKPKFPVCTPRDNSIRNIQTQHLGGNKWRVYFQAWGIMGGNAQDWVNCQHEINPTISGFSAGRTTIDVQWK